MAQALTRALILIAAASPAFAGGLPAHPLIPRPRPVFPGDPPPGSLPPDAADVYGADSSVVELSPAQTAPDSQTAPASQAAFGDPPSGPVNVPVPPEARVDTPQPPYDPRPTGLDPDGFSVAEKTGLADLTRKYAARHGLPLELLHRIIMRESKYKPHLVHRHYYGLMQITSATARGMGYKGSAKGLLDAETNLAYATPYLANAWALADGDIDRAVRLYASGYYYTAKSKGMLGAMRDAHSPPIAPEAGQQPTLAAPPPPQTSFFGGLFGR
ncbi:Transglycosylase SLT domain-containing protein [Rhodoblastus acidophilus]|uniref:Transglycosylase SLT domain-containing protein n=1 Tax=Rhodoblastus acidophilus TaxID=1074 RepID=A0A212RZF9_RHOAC|nr:lytic transglycosylase domain-containing protein [Rhodoblastus acidophilus]PPQ36917.1 hypothetical protein CKO16_16080 [Rhodoblastus acidophilus]RAI22455.1 hypothetical protein CH337_04825 [Rhodoblastus acidophilus]SNB78129.1 Transglycosylase SLT domain-containing protein [Rhodoblastus acidophilus]